MNTAHRIITVLATCFAVATAFADEPTVIQFPQEELPSEVVTPVVDSPRAVESPMVTFTNKSEVSLGAASQLDEAFYGGLLYGLRYKYNFSEKYFVGLMGDFKMTGQSNNANTLSSIPNHQLDFDRAPQLKNRYALSLGYRFIYGKISFGKETVKPISIFTQLDMGMGNYEGSALPFGTLFLNNQLFFNPKNSVILSLGIGYRQQPNPLSKSLSIYSAVPQKSDFDTIGTIGSELALAYARGF